MVPELPRVKGLHISLVNSTLLPTVIIVKHSFSLLFITFLFVGCASSPYQPTTGPVIIFEQDAHASFEGESRGEVEVEGSGYGGAEKLYPELADNARELGANAILDAEIYYAPSGWSWAAPHIKGRAVRVRDITPLRNSPLPHREL